MILDLVLGFFILEEQTVEVVNQTAILGGLSVNILLVDEETSLEVNLGIVKTLSGGIKIDIEFNRVVLIGII